MCAFQCQCSVVVVEGGGGGSVKECTPVLVFACDSVKCASVFLCVYLRARVDLCRSQTRVA